MDERFDTDEDSTRRNPWYGLLFAIVVLIVLWLLWNYWGNAQRVGDAGGDAVASVTVPDVVGKREADAVATLERAGFTSEVRLSSQTDRAPGVVVDQSPVAGTEAAPGLTVRIDVTPSDEDSPGLSFEVTGTPIVPDLVGKSRSSALSTLDRIGYAASVTEAYNNEFPADKVFAQRPAAGTALAEGSTVSISVSIGPLSQQLITVPDLTGLTEAQAIARLRTAGFVAKPVYQPRRDSVGIVYNQAPPGGDRIEAGSDVIIVVGLQP
ncbi:MAG: PASTA domain-containing protein [Coriobacteriia bacterium]|nr:PASTA domain-containing protein [Coriobacteriia bacterium]